MVSGLRVVIRGRVQGVGFRYAAAQEAARLSLAGWVRNRGDGSVEALFEGDESAIEAMQAWCEKGPVFARVESVEADRIPATGSFTAFTIR